jgi:hypothetical protein
MLGSNNDTWTPTWLRGGEAMLGQSNKTYTPLWIHNKTINNVTYDQLTIQAIQEYQSKKSKDMNITSGPRAFETLFEQFLYSIGNDFVDTAQCVAYDKETDEIKQRLEYVSMAIDHKDEQRVRDNLIEINHILLKQVNSSCSKFVSKNVEKIL